MIREEIAEYIPFFSMLQEDGKKSILEDSASYQAEKGQMLQEAGECNGMIAVAEGQLRAFARPEEGREITLYRLFPYDICLFASSCAFTSLSILLEAEEKSRYIVVPSGTYSRLEKRDSAVSSYVNSVLRERVSDMMWLVDQILNKRLNERLAALLYEEYSLSGKTEIDIRQEKLANHLGSAREVVTRVMKYLQEDGYIKAGRGTVTILSPEKLRKLAEPSLR